MGGLGVRKLQAQKGFILENGFKLGGVWEKVHEE